jgi:hypothetical protein
MCHYSTENVIDHKKTPAKAGVSPFTRLSVHTAGNNNSILLSVA